MLDYKSLDDHQLIQRVSQVDKDALEALHVRYQTPVYCLAMFMLKQPVLAEEATQDIFLNMWLKASSFNAERGQPKSWIMSLAHHKIVGVIRSRRRTIINTDSADFKKVELTYNTDSGASQPKSDMVLVGNLVLFNSPNAPRLVTYASWR